MNMSKISVIMPAHNCASTVADAIASLQKQTHKDLEIIVIDDCSTDETYNVTADLAQNDQRIILLKTPKNLRAGGARNMGFEVMTGDWVTLLDADDWWEPNRVENMLKAAENYNVDVVLDNLLIYDHVTKKIVGQTNFANSRKPTALTQENIFVLDRPTRGRDAIGYSQPLIRTDFFVKHHFRYWCKYRTTEDFILLVDIVMAGARIIILPDAFYIYRHHISPSTGQASPLSHAEDATKAISNACDDLIEKYQGQFSSKAIKELRIRKKLTLTVPYALKQNKLIKERQWLPALLLFYKAPLLLLLRSNSIWNRIRALFSPQIE